MSQEDLVGGYHYVDLGLPSGRLWATGVVSDEPGTPVLNTLYGLSTNIKSYYLFYPHQTKNEEKSVIRYAQTYFDNAITKDAYDNRSYSLLQDYDFVSRYWGNGWRIPTYYDYLELISNTTITEVTNGYIEYGNIQYGEQYSDDQKNKYRTGTGQSLGYYKLQSKILPDKYLIIPKVPAYSEITENSQSYSQGFSDCISMHSSSIVPFALSYNYSSHNYQYSGKITPYYFHIGMYTGNNKLSGRINTSLPSFYDSYDDTYSTYQGYTIIKPVHDSILPMDKYLPDATKKVYEWKFDMYQSQMIPYEDFTPCTKLKIQSQGFSSASTGSIVITYQDGTTNTITNSELGFNYGNTSKTITAQENNPITSVECKLFGSSASSITYYVYSNGGYRQYTP